MTAMPPSMAAAERYLALLNQGDTHGASAYLDRLTDDDTVDPWVMVEHLGHKLTDSHRKVATGRPAFPRVPSVPSAVVPPAI